MSIKTKHLEGMLTDGQSGKFREWSNEWWEKALFASAHNESLLVFNVPGDRHEEMAKKIEELLQKELYN